MKIIFCEECGSRNEIDAQVLENLSEQPYTCSVCGFVMDPETIIEHGGKGSRLLNTSSFTILIIDDDKAFLTLIRELLNREYRVITADSGERGLELAGKEQPDLILLDVSMPDLDGYEVCTWLKRESSTCHIPVLFITAMGDEEDEYRGLSLGAVDYITKPVALKILNARIAVHLRFRTLEQDCRDDLKSLRTNVRLLKDKKKELERRLEQMNVERRNLEKLLDTVDELVTIQDHERRLVWANKAALERFGFTLEEIVGKSCHEVFYGSPGPCDMCFLGGADAPGQDDDQDKPRRCRVRNAGLGLTLEQKTISLRDRHGKVVGSAHAAVPVKDGEQAGAEASALLESIVELNDILSIILVSADAIGNLYKDDERLTKLNSYLGDAVERLRAVFNHLRSFQVEGQD